MPTGKRRDGGLRLVVEREERVCGKERTDAGVVAVVVVGGKRWWPCDGI